jgi:uncharacterized protein (TIGR02996 family)
VGTSGVTDATQRLLQAVLDEPDDLASRRVYADALIAAGDPRGELINVQCDLATATPTAPAWAELVQTEGELLAAHAKTWSAPFAGFLWHPTYERGFIENAFVNTKKFIPACGELLEREPVTSLAMRELTVAAAGILGARPELHRLRKLRITESSLGAKGIQALFPAPLAQLRELNFYNAGIDDQGLALLAPMYAQLERLNLTATRVTYGALEHFLGDARLAKLAKLHLGALLPGTDGTGFLAEHLALPALTHLDLASSHVANEDLRHLASNTTFAKLRGLRLESNNLAGPGLGDALTPLTQLEVLDVSTNALARDAVVSLARLAVPLRVLRLYQCRIGDDHLEALATARFALRRLDLGYASVHARGIEAIGKTDWPLEKLELWACKIGDDGAAALANASFTRTLRELVVGYNNFSDVGVAALAAGSWPRLERIVFRGDSIGEAGAKALAASQTMPALRSLKFEDMPTPKRPLAPLKKRGVTLEM